MRDRPMLYLSNAMVLLAEEEAKKEEPESEDEDDADMGFGLFD